MLKTQGKIQALQQILNSSGRFLLVTAFGLWLGAILFLGYGVAPVNFGIAEDWQLEGNRPGNGEAVTSYRAIGGTLTAESIERLNHIELAAIVMAALGFSLFWIQRRNRTVWLIAETLLFTVIILIYAIYSQKIGGQLDELRMAGTIDFSVTDDAAKSADHLTFDRLHQRYTMLTGFNVILILLELLIISFKPSLRPFGRFYLNKADAEE